MGVYRHTGDGSASSAGQTDRALRPGTLGAGSSYPSPCLWFWCCRRLVPYWRWVQLALGLLKASLPNPQPQRQRQTSRPAASPLWGPVNASLFIEFALLFKSGKIRTPDFDLKDFDLRALMIKPSGSTGQDAIGDTKSSPKQSYGTRAENKRSKRPAATTSDTDGTRSGWRSTEGTGEPAIGAKSAVCLRGKSEPLSEGII